SAKTLSYTITGAEQGATPADLHAVYWLPSGPGNEMYIAVQNTSNTTIHVSAALESGTAGAPFASITLGPSESQVFGAKVPGAGQSGSGGGERFGAIRLTHDGPNGSLTAAAWMENDSTGYSNTLTLHDPGRHKGTNLFGTQVFLGDISQLLGGERALP